MTCIAALKMKNEILVGCDSCYSDHYDYRIKKESKIIQNKNLLIGVCGDGRAVQCLLPEVWDPPLTDSKITIVNSIKNNLIEHNVCMVDDESRQLVCGSTFLIVTKNNFFEISPNFYFAEFIENYTAIGSGALYSLASLWQTRNSKKLAFDRLYESLECAAYFTKSVAPPFHIYFSSTKDKTNEWKYAKN